LRGISGNWTRADDTINDEGYDSGDLWSGDEDATEFSDDGFEDLDEYERDAIEFFEESELEMNSEDGL
jgi:hypothetical protein